MKRKLIILGIIILLSFVLWWAKYLFFMPHFQEGPNKTLVSKNIKLELVTDSPEPEKLGISVPGFLPFWKTVGTVDGEMDGTLWEFNNKGKKYVLYTANTEMPWSYIYKYSTK
jgi:hypothetical protein